MSDKLRSAIFNVLGDISGLTVLDVFAGSGAVGLEALSRGAAHATCIDKDQNAVRSIKENVASLKVEKHIKVIQAPVYSWAENSSDEFDLVLVDPPFDALQLSAIHTAAQHIKKGGLCVLNYPSAEALPELDGCTLIKQRTHGVAQLAFYRRDD